MDPQAPLPIPPQVPASVMPWLNMIGLVVVLLIVFRSPITALLKSMGIRIRFNGKKSHDDTQEIAPEHHFRRRDDEMLTRYLEAFEGSAKAQQSIADSLSSNGKLLGQMLEEMRQDGARRERELNKIHERLDDLYRTGTRG